MTDERALRENCAFQLGLERRFKEAGIVDNRLHAMVDLTAKIAGEHPDNTRLEALLHDVVTHYYEETPVTTATDKTAEEKVAAEKRADAFEYGIGLTIKEAGITDPNDVQAFLNFAAELASEENSESK